MGHLEDTSTINHDLDTSTFTSPARENITSPIAKLAAPAQLAPAVDARAVASDWLSRLSEALFTRDEPGLRTLFAPIAVLRDSLVFTWDLRSPAGPAAIAAHLCQKDGGSQGLVRALTLDERPGLAPVVMPYDQPGAVNFAFKFDTPFGKGRGSARLLPREHYGDNGPKDWIADSAYMMLDSLEGQDEAGTTPPNPIGHEVPREISEAERRKKIEEEPYVLVVGAGQTGLMVAARLQQMGLPTLIIEKDARVGDEWRRRYRTLVLHTPKQQHTLLFSPYPETWPLYTPKDKLADWFEGYSKAHDMVLWTSAPLLADPKPVYSDVDKLWTVHVGQPGGGTRTVRCRHIVLATSVFGAPVTPVVAGAEAFRGQILHANKFYSGADYAGKRVLVVGAGNTAANVCEDLAKSGAACVTMLQRSSSCILLPNSMTTTYSRAYPAGIDISLMDFYMASIPWRVRERLLTEERKWKISLGQDPDVEPGDAERMRKLKEAGFLVNHWRDGLGLPFAILERLGGHLIDTGFSDLLIDGKINLKTSTELSHYAEDRVHFKDGTDLEVDAVIYATGYESATVAWSSVFGQDVIKRAGPIWGLDDESELRGVYRPSGHPALWYAGGDFMITRWGSKQLGLLLLARRLGYVQEPMGVEC